ncbi:hypothetical protein Ae201684P_017612 [Aphanomyces euteiches]|nr:hypothetical protein Ae201684P_017612 [Aphanomyces euteiches]
MELEVNAWRFLVEQWYISLHISQINREATPSYSSVIDWSDNIVSRIVCLNIVLSHALLTESHFPMSTSNFQTVDSQSVRGNRTYLVSCAVKWQQLLRQKIVGQIFHFAREQKHRTIKGTS